MSLIIIAVYVAGVLVAGYLGGREAWRHGKSGPYGRTLPHDQGYAWGCALGYGLAWPLLVLFVAVALPFIGVAALFRGKLGSFLAGKLWGEQ